MHFYGQLCQKEQQVLPIFLEWKTPDCALKSDFGIAHPQCLSKEIAHVPKRSKQNKHFPIMCGNDSTSSINNRNDFVTKKDQMRHQFNILFQKVQNYNNSTIEKANIECICCEISLQHRKKDYSFLASDGSPRQFFT